MRALRLERVLLASLIGTALCLPAARAGSLANFEAGALSGGATSSGGSSHGGDACAGPFLELAARIWLEGMVYGGVGSWLRVDPTAADLPGLPAREPREWGEGLLPVVRADTAYQWAGGDVRAVDAAVEAGFGPLAAQFTRRRFEERQPDDEMTLRRWHVLYRMSFGAGVEVDMGLGQLILDREQRTDRFSFTVPLLFHPAPGCGIEFRPAWSEDISEYDLGLLAGWKFVSLRAGYRWLHDPGETLEGPYAGLSAHF